MKNYNYSSLLRVPYCVHTVNDKTVFKKAFNKYRNSFSHIAFFNNKTHDVISLQKHREHAAKMAELIEYCKGLGIKTGVNCLCTIGHHVESPDEDMSGMDFMVLSDGRINRGVLCPTSLKTLDYIAELYEIYAKQAPDFIYADDDLDYNGNCYCDNCIDNFDKRTGIFEKYGLRKNLTNLISLFMNDDISIRQYSRSCWLDFYVYKLENIYKTIESAVHKINKKIQLGFMSCVVGQNGMGQGVWAKCLGAPEDSVLYRPGGGLYSDLRPISVAQKTCNSGRQLLYLPDNIEIQSEIENFPYQSLRKSVKYTGFEALNYLAAGCTGTAFNVISWSPQSFYEAEKYFNLAGKLYPFSQELVRTFGRNEPEGIGCYINKEIFAKQAEKNWVPDMKFENELYNIGLPICYNPKKIKAFMLNESLAANLTDDELLLHLKKGVYMNANALDIINKRGFEKYTGFCVGKSYDRNITEKALPHFLNSVPDDVRDIHLEFSLYGHPEFDKTEPAHIIEKTDQNAEYLTSLIDYNGRELGYGLGIYENSFGGRVCVSGYAAFDNCYSYARIKQLKAIFKWLTRDTLTAYVNSKEKINIWQRNTLNGRFGLIVSNISLDNLKDIEICVLNKLSSAIFEYYDEGIIHKSVIKWKTGTDDYNIMILNKFPPLTVGYIICE